MSTYNADELADNSLEDIVGGSGQWIESQKDSKESDPGKKPGGFVISRGTRDGENLSTGSPPQQTSGSKKL